MSTDGIFKNMCSRLMVLKLSRMSFDNLFQRFTALKWNDRLSGFVFHGGRSKHLNV